MKINVIKIVPIKWSRYRFAVHVEPSSFLNFDYIKATLARWFGDAEYYWGTMFLCGKR